jgi:surfactin synthase thioesterase subunit
MLIASGARAPRYRLGHVAPPDATDAELLADLRRLSGTPAELIDNPSMLHTILPALRADTSLYRHYSYQPDAPCPFAIRAYGGIDDPNVTEEHLESWSAETASSFAVRRFAGGHFYLQGNRDQLLSALTRDLKAVW